MANSLGTTDGEDGVLNANLYTNGTCACGPVGTRLTLSDWSALQQGAAGSRRSKARG